MIASKGACIADYVNTSGVYESEAGKQCPMWWVPAMTLGHLEARMHVAKILECVREYNQVMQLQAIFPVDAVSVSRKTSQLQP